MPRAKKTWAKKLNFDSAWIDVQQELEKQNI
jgi:hypothetical protein